MKEDFYAIKVKLIDVNGGIHNSHIEHFSKEELEAIHLDPELAVKLRENTYNDNLRDGELRRRYELITGNAAPKIFK